MVEQIEIKHWKNDVIILNGCSLNEFKKQYGILTEMPDRFITASQIFPIKYFSDGVGGHLHTDEGLRKYDCIIYLKIKPK